MSGDNCHGWSPTIPRVITHKPENGHQKEVYYWHEILYLDFTHKTNFR